MATDDFPDRVDGGEVTRLLHRWCAGDRQAMDGLLPLVYDELRRLAGNYLRRAATPGPAGAAETAALEADLARLEGENEIP